MTTPAPPPGVELVWPLALAGDGDLATVESGSQLEVRQSVALLLSTRPGERQDNADYGTEDPTLVGADEVAIVADVQRFEPRASVQVIAAEVAAHRQDVEVRVALADTGSGGR
jgi:phage baseplate assembly protein W